MDFYNIIQLILSFILIFSSAFMTFHLIYKYKNAKEKVETNLIVVLFMFETGDASVPYYTVPVTIKNNQLTYSGLINHLRNLNYMIDDEDLEYEERVEKLLDMARPFVEDYEFFKPAFVQCVWECIL